MVKVRADSVQNKKKLKATVLQCEMGNFVKFRQKIVWSVIIYRQCPSNSRHKAHLCLIRHTILLTMFSEERDTLMYNWGYNVSTIVPLDTTHKYHTTNMWKNYIPYASSSTLLMVTRSRNVQLKTSDSNNQIYTFQLSFTRCSIKNRVFSTITKYLISC